MVKARTVKTLVSWVLTNPHTQRVYCTSQTTTTTMIAGLNEYVTEELAFEFHYFFTRKFWMLYHCQALVVAPGGFGTLDELFEVQHSDSTSASAGIFALESCGPERGNQQRGMVVKPFGVFIAGLSMDVLVDSAAKWGSADYLVYRPARQDFRGPFSCKRNMREKQERETERDR